MRKTRLLGRRGCCCPQGWRNTAVERGLALVAGLTVSWSVFAQPQPTITSWWQLKNLSAKPAFRLEPLVESGAPKALKLKEPYTPAQIRSAYGLPDLPVPGVVPTLEQQARLGAGQTIYILAPAHNVNLEAELAAFAKRFGLPGCRYAGAVQEPLPVAGLPPFRQCELQTTYLLKGGSAIDARLDAERKLKRLSPGLAQHNPAWAGESALAVQWAHAIAPLARIQVIAMAEPTLENFQLAGKMAGYRVPNRTLSAIVSMGFGFDEESALSTPSNWDTWSCFAYGATRGCSGWINPASAMPRESWGSGLNFVAATGPAAEKPLWPASSPGVLAVGASSMAVASSGARTESPSAASARGNSDVWPTPPYQRGLIMMGSAPERRATPDVVFNGDPATGQYVATFNPATNTIEWMSASGSSLATVQWAALLAVVNAVRPPSSPLGSPHSAIYEAVGGKPGNYASVFQDISAGVVGSCSNCVAKPGWDPVSGLGSPNGKELIDTLGSSHISSTPASGGYFWVGLSQRPILMSVGKSSAVIGTLPPGASISDGILKWERPRAGQYRLLTSESALGANRQQLVVLDIRPSAPLLEEASYGGASGTPMRLKIPAFSDNPLALSIRCGINAGACPPGMAITADGMLTWTNPTVGTLIVNVTALDAALRTASSKSYLVRIADPPAVSTTVVRGTAGTFLSFNPATTFPSGTDRAVELTGAPSGMRVVAGWIEWPKPVAGTYSVKVRLTDKATKLVGEGTVQIVISPAGK